jgi:hypothetical protein
MVRLYLGHDLVREYGQFLSRSGYGCECMGCLYLGQYGSVREWAGCI